MSEIFTQAALQGRRLSELQALFQSAQQDLVRSESGSQQRRDALANLDALSLAIARRRAPGGPGF